MASLRGWSGNCGSQWTTLTPTPLNQAMKTTLKSTNADNAAAAKWAASLNDITVAIPDPTVTEDVLRTQARVPADQVIIRDHNSPADVVLRPGQIVHLREGNVFYTISVADGGERKACSAPAKLAMFVDDRGEEIGTAHQTGGSIRELFEIPDHVALFRDLHSPNDQPIEINSRVEFADGPVFYTRILTVEVSINGRKYPTHLGKNSVAHLRTLGSVPANEILSQLKDGRFEDLQNDGHVEIKGGEVFISHPPSAGSSR
jgi:hypothetical protein